MHVQYGHRRAGKRSSLQCTRNHLLLCRTIGSCQGRGSTILIHSRSCKANHMAFCVNGLSFAIQQQNTTSFTTHISICICIQCLTPAIHRQHACLLEYHTCIWSQGQVHTTSQGHGALPQKHAIASYVGSYQRRGTSCVCAH